MSVGLPRLIAIKMISFEHDLTELLCMCTQLELLESLLLFKSTNHERWLWAYPHTHPKQGQIVFMLAGFNVNIVNRINYDVNVRFAR